MKLPYVKRIHFLPTFALLLLMVTIQASPVRADVLYSTSFELLDGYNLADGTGDSTSRYLGYHGWGGSSTATTTILCDTSFPAHSGTQSAYRMGGFDFSDMSENAIMSVPYTPTAANPIVQASAYFGFGPIGGYGSGAPSATLETGQIFMGQTANGQQMLIGSLLMNPGGGFTWQTANGSGVVSKPFSVNSWYDLSIQANFITGNVEFLVNNELIGNSTFDNKTIIQFSSFDWYDANNHYKANGSIDWWNALYANTYMDNVTIESRSAVVPIPGALWLLGSGLFGLAGFRRKIKN
jgi:hypothetical protein